MLKMQQSNCQTVNSEQHITNYDCRIYPVAEMCHTSHTLTLDCCDAVDESTPDVSSIETVNTSCVATVGSLGVANVNTSGLITVGSSGVVTLGGLLLPAANTWSVGSFAVIT